MDMTKKYPQEKIDLAEFEIFKLATTFYLTVKQRAYEKELIPEFLDLIKAHLNKSIQASRWLITQFSNKDVLAECFLQCPVPDMRKLSAGLVYCAMIKVYEQEEDTLNLFWKSKEESKESPTNTLIGNFMNILISNFDILRKYSDNNTQYFRFFSGFSNLGKQARYYLLKAKMIGRLLNYLIPSTFANKNREEYYGEKEETTPQESLTDYSDIPFEENLKVEIGLPIQLENTKMSIWDQMMLYKRDSQMADGQEGGRGQKVELSYHICELLKNMICSSVITSEKLDTFIDDMRFTELTKQELSMLNFDAQTVMILLDSCQTKVAANSLGSIFIHLCNYNREFDIMLRNVLTQGINDKQLDELRAYFPIFKRYLFIQDEYSEERISESIREYFMILQNNVKFTSFMVKFTTFLVKLCNINRGVAEMLASCPNDWDWVIEWIKKAHYTSKNSQQFWERFIRQQSSSDPKVKGTSIPEPKTSEDYYAKYPEKLINWEIAAAQYKLKRLEQIKAGEIETFENEYDSDDDMTQNKFYNTQKIDYKHTQDTWVTATVIVSLDEMVNLHYIYKNQSKSPWVSIDNDDIAPHMAMQGRHDMIEIAKNKIKAEEYYHQMVQQKRYNLRSMAPQLQIDMSDNS
jgi:hypothetical protein